MAGDSFVILLSSQRLQHRPQGFGFGPRQHAVGDVMPRSGCGARASTRGGAQGTALTRCVTRKNRHEAPHWHLPLAKAGVACQHVRPCSLCWLNHCMFVAARSILVIVFCFPNHGWRWRCLQSSPGGRERRGMPGSSSVHALLI